MRHLCLLLLFGATSVSSNPQVLAYERAEARTEYEAMLSRMDSNGDRLLSLSEMDAIEDEWLIDEVHIAAAKKADADKDGLLTIDEYTAFKSPPIHDEL